MPKTSIWEWQAMKKHGERQWEDSKEPKRPFLKTDLEAVLKAAVKPLRKKQGEQESEGTSASHHSDDSSGNCNC